MRKVNQQAWVRLGKLVLLYCPMCETKIRLPSRDVNVRGQPMYRVNCTNAACSFRDHITLEGWTPGI